MTHQIVQNLRYKLQRRVRRLNSIDWQMFIPALQQFWAFFDANPTYSGISEYLSARHPDVLSIVNKIFEGAALVGKTEEESAAIGQGVLRIRKRCGVWSCSTTRSGSRSSAPPASWSRP